MDDTDLRQAHQIGGIKTQLKLIHRRIQTLETLCIMLSVSVLVLMAVGAI